MSYLDRLYTYSREALDKPSPEKALTAWLELICDNATVPANKGCFAINSLVKMAPHDEDVAKMLEYQYWRIGKLLETAIAKGQKQGVSREDLSVQQLRQLIIIAAKGTLAAGWATFLKSDLPSITESILAVIKA